MLSVVKKYSKCVPEILTEYMKNQIKPLSSLVSFYVKCDSLFVKIPAVKLIVFLLDILPDFKIINTDYIYNY